MALRRRLNAPFGERVRDGRRQPGLKSRGLVVESGPQQRTSQALRATERLSRAVIDGLDEGVIVCDHEGVPVTWNASALRILGAAPAEMTRDGRAAAFGLHDDQGHPLPEDELPAARALAAGADVRALLRRGDRWITCHARPFAGTPGTAGGVVSTLADVSQTIEDGHRLREERDRAQRYLEVAGSIVLVLDGRGRVELINRQGCRLLGFEEHELVGRDWFDTVVPPADRLDARRAFVRLLSEVEPPGETLETFVQTKSGESRMIAWRNGVLRDGGGTVTALLRAGEDVTERRRAEAQVSFLAYHDRLTGLANRALLEQQLARDLARARRSRGAAALLLFDLDNFKLVNDSFGHQAGDLVLQEAARRVSELTRGADVLARQGGDEFLLLLDCATETDPAAAAQVAGDRIAAALERPFELSGAQFHVGASIGVALFPEHGRTPEELFKSADSAMYQAKRAGGGSVAFYDGQDGDARRRLSLTTRLRAAIGDGDLVLHYQPIFRTEDGTLAGLEALVRWQDPEHGLVPPGSFIPIAEETGLVDGIGAWVVEALCAQAAAWAAQGQLPDLSFNVSPRQLRRTDLAAQIAGRIAAHDLDPARFTVEVTESAVMDARHLSLIAELRAAGLSIAIDDFGAGHSSLGRLRDLPVQSLKVDRSFVAGVPDDPRSTAIVAAVLGLGEALGLRLVVEGIEEQAQLAFLRAHGHPLAQGFLLGRPMPAEALDLPRLRPAA